MKTLGKKSKLVVAKPCVSEPCVGSGDAFDGPAQSQPPKAPPEPTQGLLTQGLVTTKHDLQRYLNGIGGDPCPAKKTQNNKKKQFNK